MILSHTNVHPNPFHLQFQLQMRHRKRSLTTSNHTFLGIHTGTSPVEMPKKKIKRRRMMLSSLLCTSDEEKEKKKKKGEDTTVINTSVEIPMGVVVNAETSTLSLSTTTSLFRPNAVSGHEDGINDDDHSDNTRSNNNHVRSSCSNNTNQESIHNSLSNGSTNDENSLAIPMGGGSPGGSRT